eukprot:s858_g6.t1
MNCLVHWTSAAPSEWSRGVPLIHTACGCRHHKLVRPRKAKKKAKKEKKKLKKELKKQKKLQTQTEPADGQPQKTEDAAAKDRPAQRSRKMEAASKGGGEMAADMPSKVDFCLVLGGYNSSNTTHLLEIAEDEGVPAYHIDCAERIGVPGGEATNKIQHKPLTTLPAQAMLDEGLEITENFLPDGPVTIGITSGASTPDNIFGDVLKRVLAIRGLDV